MADHIVVATSRVFWCNPAMKHPIDKITHSQSSTTVTQPLSDRPPPLGMFVLRLIRVSQIRTGTLMATVVYLARFKKHLSRSTTGSRCSAHRIVSSVLILTSKYLHDANPTNKSWAQYCSYGMGGYNFSSTDITRMEVQTLCLLDCDLSLPEEELYLELEPLLSPIRQQLYWLRTWRQLPLPNVPQIDSSHNNKEEKGNNTLKSILSSRGQ